MPRRQPGGAEGGLEAERTADQERDVVVGPVIHDVEAARVLGEQHAVLVDVVPRGVAADVAAVGGQELRARQAGHAGRYRVPPPHRSGLGEQRTRDRVPRAEESEVRRVPGGEDQ